MENSLFELYMTVSGRVQGVGFRYSIQNTAKSLGIYGWVRNTFDGKVEIKCYGKKDLLESFLTKIKQTSSHAKVTKVDEKWIAVTKTDYSDFSIIF